MLDSLTRDAQKLILKIYKNYLTDTKNGMSRSQARNLGGSNNVQIKYAPNTSLDDVDDLLRELHRAGYIKAFFADDTVYHAELTTQCVSKMEKRFSDGIKEITELLSKFF